MFEVPGSDIKTVVLTDEVVKGKGQAVYIRSPDKEDTEPTNENEDSGYEEQERMSQN